MTEEPEERLSMAEHMAATIESLEADVAALTERLARAEGERDEMMAKCDAAYEAPLLAAESRAERAEAALREIGEALDEREAIIIELHAEVAHWRDEAIGAHAEAAYWEGKCTDGGS